MTQNYRELGNRARECLSERAYAKAGDCYSFAAYWALGQSEYTATMTLGSSLYWYLAASLCYRLADDIERAQNRCRQGILVVEDLREYVWEERVRIGLTYELEGDFRVLGNLGASDQVYENARERYVTCENTIGENVIGWMGEPEFELPMLLFLRAAAASDYDIDFETAAQLRDFSLIDRIEYKRVHFPAIVEQVLDRGHFEY